MAHTATYQDFVAAQEKEEYPVASEQLSALKILFSDPTYPTSELAKQIAEPILKALEEKPTSPVDCFRIWRTIAAAIKQLTGYNHKLVELVVELQKAPDPLGYIALMQDFREHWTEFAFDFDDPPS
ncbi:hypothetical protein K432DRAFT_403048 [Lepidopterella palustris CBS 459.81]|uniref:Uncharacterized protein n=1 Tax=Lepidopterella palustris CBS 459.81 TaxID=1314670 RepID=A0A8E2EDZ6_9PEZI|nr:hypothetical protein K432DRAFT_403048 [Lepidopterella palustris CBS 459.81]